VSPRLGLVGLALLAASLVMASACRRAAGQDWQLQDHIEVIDGQTWVVGSRLVTVAPSAAVDGQPAVGALVQLQGQRTAAGELVAEHVQVLADDAADEQPAAAPQTDHQPAAAPQTNDQSAAAQAAHEQPAAAVHASASAPAPAPPGRANHPPARRHKGG
jgi:hypothetical protein